MSEHHDRPPLHRQAVQLAESVLLWECLTKVPHLAEPLAEVLDEVARSRITRVAATGLIFIEVEQGGEG